MKPTGSRGVSSVSSRTSTQVSHSIQKVTNFVYTEKTGTMPWKALKKLLEMKGIKLAHEDGEKLHRQLRVKGDNDIVSYKEALSYL